jgi:hypothetical protein
MRGSPLLRSIFMALALAATGLGLARVTAPRNDSLTTGSPPPTALPGGGDIPFRLLLSAPAAQVEIDTGKVIRLPVDGLSISGVLELDSKNPRLGLVIRWKQATARGEHRFAKITLEAPGQETLTHVFDAEGDIDDFVELPFPVTP